ncbi:MAG: hypothetical protein AAGL90_03685 [Pseudomonadota bacterium]
MIAKGWVKHISFSILALVMGAAAAQAQFDANDPEPIAPAPVEISDDRLDRAMAVYEADESLQRTRPEASPEDFEGRARNTSPNPIAQAIAGFFRSIGSLLGYLLAAIVLIAILAGLYMAFGESLSLRRRQKEKSALPDVSMTPNLRPEQKRARALLEDADALAARGQYAEAVHLLLFRSIDDIQEKRSGIIGRSLTSREIGALGVLPDRVRDALLPIIRIVERSFFGGASVTEAGWKDARASYQEFAFGEAWT